MRQIQRRQIGTILLVGLTAVSFLQERIGQSATSPTPTGKLEAPLLSYMSTMAASKQISVIVVLTNQATEAQKRVWLRHVTATNSLPILKQTRQIIINELRELATDQQSNLLPSITLLQSNGIVRNVRPLWCPNAIALHAPASVLRNLATSNDVAYIHLDLPRHALAQKSKSLPKNFKTIGISTLSAPENSQNVAVAVIDSGVKFDHPDLVKRMWINPPEDLNHNGRLDPADINHIDDDKNGFVDDVLGWNFPASNDQPLDALGHGTGVAGVIAGDGTVGPQTGIALNARIMALCVVPAEDPQSTTEHDFFEAMQYAVSNGANVLNLSAAFIDNPKCPPSYGLWRQVIDNYTEAGVLCVVAAGDFGPPRPQFPIPFNIGTPGRVPSALTVGYLQDSSDIDQHSSTGPVTWMNVGGFLDYPFESGIAAGLIKPDLTALGDNILTLGITSINSTTSGSSISTPQVAAVAALLWGQKPELNAFDVRFILEETATACENPPNPNSKAGWGCVNVPNALKFTINSGPPSFDLSVGTITATIRQSQLSFFSAGLTNVGNQVVGNSELRFYFADAQTRQLSDLDPGPDGEPDPKKFQYIGSSFIPILGPTGSGHQGFTGTIGWTVPALLHTLWIGVVAKPGPRSDPEANQANNRALTSFP